MNEEKRTEDHARGERAVVPPYIWVLTMVALLLAAVGCLLWALYALRVRNPMTGPSPTPIIWTATPQPSPSPVIHPTETSAPTPTISPEIAIGRFVRVSGTEGAGVSLRQQPDVNSPRISTDLTLGVGQEGEVFIVVDGPRQTGGYTWWLVQDAEDEARKGWAVGNYLQPVEHP
ncbi:MAG: hypothetical protein PVH62_01600 [Anaerolineae bacterium]|jgi:hypothetical protein